ncbi:GreA/GreB family elongation factor [Elusimicrobiota bacterium]
MSSAFVKGDGDQHGDQLPERPIPPGPNYVTARGRALLQEKVLELEAERRKLIAGDDSSGKQRRQVERDLRYYDVRLRNAVVVNPSKQEPGVIRFGARIEARCADAEIHCFTIVGEDEADASAGTVSWSSPISEAVLGAKVGDTVEWKRPAGNSTLEILKVEYPQE